MGDDFIITFFDKIEIDTEPAVGGKARTLAMLYQAGLNVPDGFIISPQAFTGDLLTQEAWEQVQACIARLRHKNRGASFAVRSSALGEDSAQASFAGAFDTVLDVSSDSEIREAVHTVRLSRNNERAGAYAQAQGIENDGGDIAMIVQILVRADISGVLFTADPVTGSLSQMTGNFIRGMGDALVSGQMNPETFTLSRPRGAYTGPPELEKAAKSLYRNACRIERMLGAPQDMEWAIKDGRLYILQSRPITTLQGYKPDTCEFNDSLTGRFLWCNTNLSEQAPEVRTPFSCSMMKIHETEGPYSKVYNGMSVGGHPLTGIIGGRAYSNMSVLLTANRPMMGGDARKAAKMLSSTYGDIPESADIPLIPISAFNWWTKVLPGLLRYVKAMNRCKGSIMQYAAENPRKCAGIRQRISAARTGPELMELWQNEIKPHYLLGITLLFASTIDISPRLQRYLRELAGPEDANALLSNLGGKSGELESLGPVIGLYRVSSGKMSREDYMQAYGHRGENEFEYAWPRPIEDFTWIDRELAGSSKGAVDAEALIGRQRSSYEAAWERFKMRYPNKANKTEKSLEHAAMIARRREAIRSEAIRTMAAVRAFALRAGELAGIGEDIFFLTIDEVCDLLNSNTGALSLIPLRKETYKRYRALPQYPSIIVGRFDPFKWAADPHRRSDIFDANAPAAEANENPGDTLKGFAGALGIVEGSVRRIERLEDSSQFMNGEILVTSITNIGWTPLFPRAAAIVTDIGAPLSHAAIVARELGIPAVVGCGNATMVLNTGDRVRVDGGKGLVEIIRRARQD